MTIGLPPLCFNCKHKTDTNIYKQTCKAFPEGIPEEILFKRFIHKEPFPGDNGILYEPKDEE